MLTKKKPKSTKSKLKQSKRIALTLAAPEAQNVFLVGDFNNWDETLITIQEVQNGKSRLVLMPSTSIKKVLGTEPIEQKAVCFIANRI